MVKIEPLNITVCAGGEGVEAQISWASGRAVYAALGRLGHRVALCDVRPSDLSALYRPANVVFIALHGEFGEDGTVQRLLDELGVSYCGSGAAASALAFDKAASKEVFARHGIPTPDYRVVTASDRWESSDPGAIKLPSVIKPLASGSSVDITIVRTRQEWIGAVQGLVEQAGRALVESYIQGPELTVSILADKALPVCQIKTKREFYDYQAKYLDDDTEYGFDIDLPADLLAQIQAMSVRAHRLLGCRTFSRADWVIDGRTLQPYLLEINTIPGFTNHSLLPKCAARAGIGFDELCNRIIQCHVERKNKKTLPPRSDQRRSDGRYSTLRESVLYGEPALSSRD